MKYHINIFDLSIIILTIKNVISLLDFTYPSAINLPNKNIFIVEKEGIYVYDENMQNIENIYLFQEENEKINNFDILSTVRIIFKGNLISCLINKKIFFFDYEGKFFSKTDILITEENYYYPTLTYIRNEGNYYYYTISYIIGSYNQRVLYYRLNIYDKSINPINQLTLDKMESKNGLLTDTYDYYNMGLSCDYMQCENKEEYNYLVCFMAIKKSNKISLTSNYFSVTNSISIDKEFKSAFLDDINEVKQIQSVVRDDRKNALVCLLFINGDLNCYKFHFVKNTFYDDVEFYSEKLINFICRNTLYGLKLDYLDDGNIISLSCINSNSTVQAIFFNNNLDLIDSITHTQFTQCESIYGHSIIQSNSFYYVISDVMCENYKRCYEPLDGNLSLIEIINQDGDCSNGEYYFSLNNSCLKTCPHNYEINNNKCIFKSFEQDTTFDEFKNQIKNNINSYFNSSEIINGTNFLAVFLTSDIIKPEEQLNKGISAIDLGNCTETLKEYYNISNEESLIILNMESKTDKSQNLENNDDRSFNLGKNTELEIYDYEGNNLNISICKNKIKIMKYLGDVNQLDFNSSKLLSEQGIDVFNASNDFFNDICYQYNNKYGKDIILDDRRNDIYQNATFCQDGCTYNGIDYDLMAANCLCNINSLQEKDNIMNESQESESCNFKSITKLFIENLLSFNFEIVKCYNVLNKKIFMNNVGFYCFVVMFLLQIIFFSVYLVKNIKPLKMFMISFMVEKNKISYNKEIIKENRKNNKKMKLKNKKIVNNEKSKDNFENKNSKRNLMISQNFAQIINMNSLIEDTHSNKNIDEGINNKEHNKEKSIKNNLFDNSNNDIKNANILNTISGKNNNNINNKDTTVEFSKTDADNQDLDYEEAIIYDKRPYLKIYLGFLVDSQIILNTFCTDNNLDLFIIKLSFLVFNFQISFFLNAFFYTDEYISKAYHNDGVLDFVSGLPKSIYSSIITLILTNLLRFLSSSKSELMKVIKRYRLNNNYVNIINSKLSKLKKKLFAYFVIIFVFDLFFLYYITVFCSVYKYSQKYWFIGCLESFGFDYIATQIICYFLALLRYISIKTHIKCLYILGNIIGAFL